MLDTEKDTTTVRTLTTHEVFDIVDDESDHAETNYLDDGTRDAPFPTASDYEIQCEEDFNKSMELTDSIFKPLEEFTSSDRRLFALTWRNLMRNKRWGKLFILDHHVWLSNLFYHKCQMVKLPKRATRYSAGYDVYLPCRVRLNSGASELIDTGVRLGPNFPKDCYVQIKQRSSLFIQGINVFEGVIDADYTGTIKLQVENVTQRTAWTGAPGIRIAQFVILKYNHYQSSDSECDSDIGTYSNRIRSGEGFGSTGQ